MNTKEQTTEIITVNTIYQVPSVDAIRALPRGKKLRLVFANSVQEERQAIGEYLKKEFPGFLISMLPDMPDISIAKLITREEVIAHQQYFEQCAHDYRNLGSQLMFQFASEFKLNIQPDTLFATLKRLKKQSGSMGAWWYYIHGFHCSFNHKETNQAIEVPIAFGFEFGVLDPYFFAEFINTNPGYRPLPVEIYEEYYDGRIINETMLALGKFEQVSSIFGSPVGTVVTNREKVVIPSIAMESITKEKPGFSLFNLFKRK